MAVLVPIPDALISDSKIPLWDEIQAREGATAYAKQVCAWIYGAPDVGQHNYLVRNPLGPNRAERRHPLGAV